MDALVHLYAPAFLGFLGVCALFLCRKPADDPLSDAADWEGPFIPASDLKLLHSTAIVPEGQ